MLNMAFTDDDNNDFEVSFEQHWKSEKRVGIQVRCAMGQMVVYPEVANCLAIRKADR